MDDLEDDANGDGLLEQSRSGTNSDSQGRPKFQHYQHFNRMNTRWQEPNTTNNDSLTITLARRRERKSERRGIRPNPNPTENIPWVGRSYETKIHFGKNVSNGSAARERTDKREAMSGIARRHASTGNINMKPMFSVNLGVPSSRERCALHNSELIRGGDELSNSFANKPIKSKEVQERNQSDRRAIVDTHRWTEHLHEKVNPFVDVLTQSLKEDTKDYCGGITHSGDTDASFTLKSNLAANTASQGLNRVEGITRGSEQNREGRVHHFWTRAVMVTDKSSENRLLAYCENYRCASTEKVTANTSNESTPTKAQPIQHIRKSMKDKAGNATEPSLFSYQDTDEILMNPMNEKVRSLHDKDPDELCKVLANQNKWMEQLIQISCSDQRFLKNVVDLLEKALSARVSQQAAYTLIIILKDASFFESAVVPFLSSLLVDKSVDLSPHVSLLEKIAKLVLIFLSKTPTSMVLIFGLLDLLQRVACNLHDNETSEASLQVIEDAIREIQSLKENQARQRVKKSIAHPVNRTLLHEYEQPLNNFRSLTAYPQLEEIKAEHPPFLRTNKDTGEYTNLEHYLDVQYRLLREDFICPLREGIRIYRQNIGTHKKVQDLHLYYHVKIHQMVPGKDGIYHVLSFDVSLLRHVEWAESKRLIFGSFLCLSSDNFETVLFATVADRDPQFLKHGIVHVQFQTDIVDVMKKSRETFVMAETIAFFEAYKHVLLGLQKVIRLPFQKYLVHCEKKVDPPSYLVQTDFAYYDITPLIDSEMIISKWQSHNRQTRFIRVMNLEEWPSAEDLNLNASQYNAIQTALTRSLSITQGPPGTGKTYLGLQIVRVLLHNRRIWSKENEFLDIDGPPMLIVCYTNHALDQFLEGISKFYHGNIVRVGGRSSSKALEEYQMHKFRGLLRRQDIVPENISCRLRLARVSKERYTELVKMKAGLLNRDTHRIMFDEEELYPFMRNHYDSLISGFEENIWDDIEILEEVVQNAMPYNIIEEWLGCGGLMKNNKEIVDLLENMNIFDGNANDTANDIHFGIVSDAEDVCRNVMDESDAIEVDRIMRDKEKVENIDVIGIQKPSNQVKVNQTTNMKRNQNGGQEHDGAWHTSKAERRKQNKDLQKDLYEATEMGKSEAEMIVDVWQLDFKDRWRLYLYWRKLYLNAKEEDFVRLAKEYDDVVKECKKVQFMEDKFVLQCADVIGMTTTCAARYQLVLQEIGPRIIIVEEAAEVLESHVITTLSEHCQHLILIGDHEQLRPNTATYTLAKDYKLDISLFERMVSNGIQCDCLEEQHRMRPEISMLLLHIYRNLRDHVSVTEYEHIRGVGSDIFFIDHTQEELHDAEQKSHLNTHEAKYVVALCKYLLRQGYSPYQITVLTTYSGQLFCLRNMMPKSDFDGVKVTVVDNYQGEENDIILLSLVRSNREGKIGYLKISNRICVALSRAKKGLYVIGNFSFLARHSELWRNIVKTLEKEKRLGEAPSLYCQNHPNDGFKAADAHDFEKFAPDGGCKRECKVQLKCRHVCKRLCHPDDRDHKKYQCQEPCERLCERGHSCKKPCYQICLCTVTVAKEMTKCDHVQDIPCYLNPDVVNCKFLVSRTLPVCGHNVTVECWKSLSEIKCSIPCKKRLRFGHVCQRRCVEMHTTHCLEKVEKVLGCGHKIHLQCCNSKSTVICTERCTRLFTCGHTCNKICGDKHYHNQYCSQMVNKTAPGCGHLVQALCNIPDSKLKCENSVEVKLNCGHISRTRCGQETIQKCNFMMKKNFECGHISDVPCHRAESSNCKEKCDTLLVCGHHCSGDCTECFKGRLHKQCSVSKVEVLICGHACTVLCSYCPPCEKKCDQKCHHKSCMKGCSEVCEPCKEPCSWTCPHFKCTKTCSEICDRPPCNEPCIARLGCGHSCIGICGEPCPTLCRTCDTEKVTKRRFGKENSPKSMFVQLCDCGDVVEVTAMDRWMERQIQQGNVSEIRFPVCPVCRTPIRNSVRYQRELKKIRRAIRDVKSKLCSSERKDPLAMNDLISEMKTLEFQFKVKSKVGHEKQLSEAFKQSMDTFKKWVSKQNDNMTAQQQMDIRDEFTRLQLMLKLMIVSHENTKVGTQLTWDLQNAIETSRTVLLSEKRLGNSRNGIECCVENLARLSTSSALDEPLMMFSANWEVKKEWFRETWMTCAAGHIFRKVELIRGVCPSCLSTVRHTAV